MEEKRLKEKVALITGSSRGIGRVVASHLANLGAYIVVHGTTQYSTRSLGEGESLDAVAREISQEHGVEVLPVFGDLTSEDTVRKIIQDIHKKFNHIDILVNCAGGDIGTQGVTAANAGKPKNNDAVHISLEDMRTILDRNLMTCILTCREVAPEMIERKSGWIVNIGSIMGLAGHQTEAIYSTAKAAVHEYTRCLAAMLRPYNVYANAVAPGGIITPRFLASRPIEESRKVKDGTLERYGWPIEIAKAVAFLVTNDSSYISGQILRVDGGQQLWPA
jgi:3-oxoacyl-[acyl-carrier protein] reductase